MQRSGDVWTYSPSDLIQFVENEAITWFNRYDWEHPRGLTRDAVAADEQLIRQAGEKHEAAFLAELIREGRDLANLRRSDDVRAATLAAMRAGREIIYQARLEAGEFAGYADFLIRVAGDSRLGSYHYEVWDTKLARSLKPYFAIQLCCYAEMLEARQGRRPEYSGIVLGNGTRQKLKTDDYFFYYRSVKQAFLDQQRAFDPLQAPVLSGTADYGPWAGHVTRILEERDDLSFIANIRSSQMQKLRQAGIDTMSQLAAFERESVARMERDTFQRLRNQARLQIESVGKAKPAYELVTPDPDRPGQGFGKLPQASQNDVCFDIEGYPLIDGGLEYLLGVTLQENGEIQFRDWWAHDRLQERAAFEHFVLWVHERWKRDPTMHVYHYAAYEVSALKRLMCRHACCETEVDDLLRNQVFVDLYAVVRQALTVGEPSYSLKDIEHLYMGRRTGAIATAGASIVYYHQWLEGNEGPSWQESPTLRQIRDYNEEDCRSTWRLLEWLREVRKAAGIPVALVKADVKPLNEVTTGRAALAQAMLAEIPADPGVDSERWRVHGLLAHLLEFHRREHKPAWWRRFERADMTEQELYEDPDCLAGLVRTPEIPQLVDRSWRYEYRFDPNQESKLQNGDPCLFSHDIQVKVEIDRVDYAVGLLYLKLGKKRAAPPVHLSLIPDEIFRARDIVDSIERTVREYRLAGKISGALCDFLFRLPPSVGGNPGDPIIPFGTDLVEGAKQAILRMNHTTLCIQGPPGCGKTYTGGELIALLLQNGKRVGVASNSHRAICLLLKSAAEGADRLGATFTGAKAGADEDQESIHPSIKLLPKNGDVFDLPILPDLVGGTAWVFSNSKAAGAFDYLFVDEAGQVSVANLVGMAPSAKNLVLLGDQMQLNQPIQGVHPGESGKSVLEYLLGEAATISPEQGIFLSRTWRMRPEVCQFISDGVYDGRLLPHPATSERRLRFGAGERRWVLRDRGVVFIPVLHEGCTYESEAEVDLIVGVVKELCGHSLELPDKPARTLQLGDILVVAPYNLQVRRLSERLPGVRVGTVDKFQGQEGPVVIFSMTASEGEATTRGIEFLFSRNRLNVAISRAQILTIVLGSPKLERTRCSRLSQIRLVNLFCRAAQAGSGTFTVPA